MAYSIQRANDQSVDDTKSRLLAEAYKSKRDELYFTALKESAVDSFTRNGEHVRFFSSASPESSLMLEVLESESKQDRLREKLGIE